MPKAFKVFTVVKAKDKNDALVKTANKIERTLDLHDSMQVEDLSLDIKLPIKDLKAVIKYLYDDELKHFEEETAEGYNTRNHIWNSICKVENYLLRIKD